MPHPNVQGLITFVKLSRSRFLFGLDQTPDDRLNWTSGVAGKTPLQLAFKTTAALEFLTYQLKTGQLPEQSDAQPEPTMTREAAKQAVAQGHDELIALLQELKEDDFGRIIKAPLWDVTLADLLWWVPSALAYHQGQLNYAQLTYGDEDFNIPPDWFSL